MVLKKLLLHLLIVFLFPFTTYGQKQANHWHFGDKAGLNFNGTLSAIGNGKLNTQEGCSGYSDPQTGQLLFYTSGDTVWNKNNVMMPNGFGLGGHNSSTQSGLVVPKPGSTTQFYIFSTGAWGGMNSTSTGSFNLNVVDMTLNSGLGDVTIKNQVVLSQVCEKLTATMHCNGVDYWVVVHKYNSDKFYTYLLTSTGLAAVPVISTLGIAHADTLGGNGYSTIGYMKISPDGKKLALACYTDIRTVELFDFDYTNGIISNKITDTSWYNYHGNSGLYGIAFSPDNSKLYVSDIVDSTLSPSNVYQYDLSSGNAAAILASKSVIQSTFNSAYGALQLAPNGKIYLAKSGSPKLDVINSPNTAGAGCNYVPDGLQMGIAGLHTSKLGLPNFVEIFNTPTKFILTYDGCGGTYTAILLDTVIPFPITVVWNFGDAASGVNNTSTLFHPSHTFSNIGSFNVSLTITGGCTNFVYNTVVDLTDSFQVDYINDTTLCTGNNIQLVNSFSNGINYQWTPTAGLSCTNCSSPIASPTINTTYIVTIDDGPGCHDKDTIIINITNGVTSLISNDTAICPGKSVQLVASGGTSYLWYANQSLSSLTIPNPIATPIQTFNNYTVIVSIPGCTPDTASVSVTIFTSPEVDAGPDLNILLGNSIIVDATSNAFSFLWHPGVTLNDSTMLTPLASPAITTTYTITVENISGCSTTDTIIIFVTDGTVPEIYFPNAFSPNEDGINDFFDYFNFGFDKVVVKIYNRWGQLLYETNELQNGWDGTYDELKCSIGVYIYTAVATDRGSDYFYKGNFTLIR